VAKDRAVHTDRPPLRVTSVAMSGPNPGQGGFSSIWRVELWPQSMAS